MRGAAEIASAVFARASASVGEPTSDSDASALKPELSIVEQLRDLKFGDLLSLLGDRRLEEPRYIDLKSTDLYRPALRAIKEGKLAAFKVDGSRKLWVRADDFYAWIESPAHRVNVHAVPESDSAFDEIDQWIDAHDRKRAS